MYSLNVIIVTVFSEDPFVSLKNDEKAYEKLCLDVHRWSKNFVDLFALRTIMTSQWNQCLESPLLFFSVINVGYIVALP